MLIKAATGKEVPVGKLPLDVGIVIQNIGTAVSIHDAVVNGEPLITAALTVSGKGIKNPKNVIVPVGTPILDVIDFCGGVTEDAAKGCSWRSNDGSCSVQFIGTCDESYFGHCCFDP